MATRDYVTRLYNEYIDLDFKISKLKNFLEDNNDIEEFKISLMYSQLNAMQQYKAILLERMKLEGKGTMYSVPLNEEERDYEDVY